MHKKSTVNFLNAPIYCRITHRNINRIVRLLDGGNSLLRISKKACLSFFFSNYFWMNICGSVKIFLQAIIFIVIFPLFSCSVLILIHCRVILLNRKITKNCIIFAFVLGISVFINGWFFQPAITISRGYCISLYVADFCDINLSQIIFQSLVASIICPVSKFSLKKIKK